MLEIAICDDDAIILKTLGKYFGKLNDATIKYDIYNSADTLYRYVEEQGTVYDVFILDIEMQGDEWFRTGTEDKRKGFQLSHYLFN